MPESTFRVAVWPSETRSDDQNRSLDRTTAMAHQLGIHEMAGCITGRLYFLQGEVDLLAVTQLCHELLADPVTERFEATTLESYDRISQYGEGAQIEVSLLPGVTDPAAENLVRAAQSQGHRITRAATGQLYQVEGDLTADDLTRLATTVFSNPVIQQTAVNAAITPPFFTYHESDGLVVSIPLTEATDEELVTISQERRLSMNLEEMQAIRSYFQQEGREPTDVELEMLAQTWSEHCVHKTFKALITYTGPDGQTEEIDGILNRYIRAATDEVQKPWVRSAFVDNAGIVAFTDQFDLAFKVETHNHPSALEPFGGANTGIGGVVRDVLGVSARPIANTDILCFGPQEMPNETLPAGVLHPRRVQSGVIAGIEDYGNKMGIPTVNGAIVYDVGYTANPLVYCGCLGILPVGSHRTAPQAGDLVVAVGGRTGRDGLRGATFSSMEMDTSTSEIAGTAVQIGHPIQEKQVQEVILRARDEELYTAITDCGAGGFSSAVGEMSEKLGARIQLQDIQLKYPGLRPWEIWLSEAQERMVLAVPPENLPRLQEICAGQNAEATVLGNFTGDKRLQIFYGDQLVGDLREEFLHDGIPQRRMVANWTPPAVPEMIPPAPPKPPAWALLQLLAHPNIRSKEETIRQYDHEVQAGTAIKPLVGVDNHGPSDAAVLVPLDTQNIEQDGRPIKAAALSNGICPQFAAVDPYFMAWAAIDEAVRNAVAVGADPDQLSILDNFCWGNPNLSDRLGALVRCAQGCYDAAVAYGTPYISGKDSLNNEYTGADGQKHAIPGTLLVSALGIVPDVTRTATMDFKKASDIVYLVGNTRRELAGSHYATLMNIHPSLYHPPRPQTDAVTIFRTVHEAIQQQLVTAIHDCSEGGLAVALAEMALAGHIGAKIDLSGCPTDEALNETELLFSESLTRFVITVPAEQQAAFATLCQTAGIPFGPIGHVGGKLLEITPAVDTAPIFALEIAELDNAFRGHVNTTEQAHRQPPPATLSPPAPTAMHLSSKPRVLVLHANGTNRDRDAALACEYAGGDPEIVHINQLLDHSRSLANYQMLVIPGGFSYGDDLGAGVLWSADLRHLLGKPLETFVTDGRPVLGICNGFQVLAKSGLLGDSLSRAMPDRTYTLTYNRGDRFECRWVWLEPQSDSQSLFTRNLIEPIYCPVAHGEGRFAVKDEATLERLQAEKRIAITYLGDNYPANPNGSVANIAGICNRAGNVMGLMPHPEDHIFPWQHPGYHRGHHGNLGLSLFTNGIKAAGEL